MHRLCAKLTAPGCNSAGFSETGNARPAMRVREKGSQREREIEAKQEGARESPLSFLPSEGSFALLLLFAQQRSTLLDRFLCHVNVFCLVHLRHAFDL